MSQYSRFVGVDISRDRLDVHVHPGGAAFFIDNTPRAAADLAQRFAGAAFACEASGGYERIFVLAMAAAGEAVWRLHPADVRGFARLQGVRAKTDPIDARMIARACAAAAEQRKPTIADEAAENLRDLLALRSQTLEEIAAWRGRLTRLKPAAARIARSRLKSAELAKARLDTAIDAAIVADESLRVKARRIASAPGAGRLLAAAILAYMPELGRLSSRQAASLAGVAPHPRQSGQTLKPGRCQAGRPQLRRVLYMAALAAIRANKAPFATFYQRLRQTGKPHKVAIVAVMRKLIIALNTMLNQNREWRPALNTVA